MDQITEATCQGVQGDDAKNHTLSGQSGIARLIRFSGWVIGAIALYAFVKYFFDWDNFRQDVSQTNKFLLFGSVAAYVLGLLVRAIRWTFVVRSHQSLSWAQGCHVIMVSNAANLLFPVRLGEILKLIIVKKSFGVAYSSSTAASIIEKLTLFILIVVFLGAAPFAGFHFTGWSAKFFPFLGLLLFCSAICLFFGKGVIALAKRRLENFLILRGTPKDRIQRVLSNRFVRYIESTSCQCHYSSYSAMSFVMIMVLGFLTLALDGLTNYLLLAAFGLHLTYIQAVIAACFFNVLFLLPSPPAQLGTAEMFPVLIYTGGLKLAGSAVASSALVWHMFTALIAIILGLISLYAVGLPVSTVIKMACRRSDVKKDMA